MLSGRDSFVATAIFGVGLYLVAVAIIAVAILIALPSDIYYAFIFGLPAVIVAAVLMKVQRWGLLVGLLGSAVGLLLLSEDADLFLTTPKSFFDFAVTLFGIVGLLVALGACIAGTVQYFRGKVDSAEGRIPLPVMAIAPVLAVLAAVSLVLTVFQTGDVSDAEAAGAVVITAKEAKWDLSLIEVEPGKEVRLIVRNTDPIMHTFTIHDLDMDFRLGPWSEKLIVIENPRTQIYGFICRIAAHQKDMSGAIVVE